MSQSDFERLAEALKDAWWDDCRFKQDLLDATGDPHIAWAVFGRCENQALEWLATPSSALDGDSPALCLRTLKGRDRLKNVLMRMP